MAFISDIDIWADKCVSDPRWLAECMQRIGRFGGQHPQSNVLRHTLEVWRLCRDLSPQAQLWALHHDAHEVLTGDVSRAHKSDSISEFQEDADRMLLLKLGIAHGMNGWYGLVSDADTLHGDREAADLTAWRKDRLFSDWAYAVPAWHCVDYFVGLVAGLRCQT